jgi:putative addiction module killer protein
MGDFVRLQIFDVSSRHRGGSCTAVAYTLHSMMLRRTEEFDVWLRSLRDERGRAKVLVRLERLEAGNPGDVGPVGEGVSELRIDFGPGYRVYYKRRGERIDILWGGDKGSQERDIRKAKALAVELEFVEDDHGQDGTL